jgi:hypothetical protein
VTPLIVVRRRRKLSGFARFALGVLLVVLVLAIWVNYADYSGNIARRDAFIARVNAAASFDELQDAVVIPRADGSWILAKSEAGATWGSWTVAVDSTGRWFENNDRNYDLRGALTGYRAHLGSVERLAAMKKDPTVTPAEVASYEASMKEREERYEKTCYPFQIQRAATLEEARTILHTMGFHDVAGLPRPRLAGVATRPAATSPSTAPAGATTTP